VLGVFGGVGDVALAAAGPSLVAVVGWWYGSRLSEEVGVVVVIAGWQTKLHPRLAFASEGGGISAGWRVMGAGCRNNKENENKYIKNTHLWPKRRVWRCLGPFLFAPPIRTLPVLVRCRYKLNKTKNIS
jgi:hypothetical protein